MSSHAILVEDDPDHPEGGHALVLFEGLDSVPPDASLIIEAIDETSNDKWPVPRPLSVRAGPNGALVAIDERIVELLPAGTAVTLSIPEVGAHGEVLWPPLTPLLRQARKRPTPIKQRARRVVAEPARLDRLAPLPQSARRDVAEPRFDSFDDAMPPRDDVAQRSIEVPVKPELSQEASKLAQVPEPKLLPKPLDPVRKHGLSTAVAAVLALLSFGGGTAIGWFGRAATSGPAPQQPAAKPAVTPTTGVEAALASPYDMLANLGPVSPGSVSAEPGERAVHWLSRGRSLVASDPAEADYWLKRAMRGQLMAGDRLSAAIVSSFANSIGRTRTTASGIAAARFLWEMAAVAHDCGAVENLRTVHAAAPGGAALDAPEAAKWRKLGQASCGK